MVQQGSAHAARALPLTTGGSGLVDSFKRFCYNHGKFLERRADEGTARLLYQADMEMTPGMFLSLWFGTGILGSVAGIVGAVLIFASPVAPFGVDLPQISLPGLPFTIGGTLPYIVLVSGAVAAISI
ncbi:MAG TPA: hypothetical protein VEI51_05700, partial [Methanomicrobiales archaeon]|nr:hypothetical protein [Methanomicrobiales archaeon]